MHQLAGRHGALDGVEEADEFLVGMALHAATVHNAFQGVEGGEQGSSAVPLVIVCHGSALPSLIGRPGWVRSSAWI